MKPFTLDVLNFVQDKTEEKYLAWLNLVNKLRTHARECGLPELDKLIGSVTKSLAGTTYATFVVNKHPHFGNVYNEFKNKVQETSVRTHCCANGSWRTALSMWLPKF